jgi:hypothetical protein
MHRCFLLGLLLFLIWSMADEARRLLLQRSGTTETGNATANDAPL